MNSSQSNLFQIFESNDTIPLSQGVSYQKGKQFLNNNEHSKQIRGGMLPTNLLNSRESRESSFYYNIRNKDGISSSSSSSSLQKSMNKSIQDDELASYEILAKHNVPIEFLGQVGQLGEKVVTSVDSIILLFKYELKELLKFESFNENDAELKQLNNLVKELNDLKKRYQTTADKFRNDYSNYINGYKDYIARVNQSSQYHNKVIELPNKFKYLIDQHGIAWTFPTGVDSISRYPNCINSYSDGKVIQITDTNVSRVQDLGVLGVKDMYIGMPCGYEGRIVRYGNRNAYQYAYIKDGKKHMFRVRNGKIQTNGTCGTEHKAVQLDLATWNAFRMGPDMDIDTLCTVGIYNPRERLQIIKLNDQLRDFTTDFYQKIKLANEKYVSMNTQYSGNQTKINDEILNLERLKQTFHSVEPGTPALERLSKDYIMLNNATYMRFGGLALIAFGLAFVANRQFKG